MADKPTIHFDEHGRISGIFNKEITAEHVLRFGRALGTILHKNKKEGRVLIGKDTRVSGYTVEQALTAGLLASGANVFQFGPLPRPGVATLTRSMRADCGIMISAPNQPYYENGMVVFGEDGQLISKDWQSNIENMINGPPDFLESAASEKMGRAKRIDDAQARYIEAVKGLFPDLRLGGFRIIVDPAHGASYKVAKTTLWEMGAETIDEIGSIPNGTNINENCGATAPRAMSEKVKELRADFGIALNGDGSELVVADEKGRLYGNGQLAALLESNGRHMNGDALVAALHILALKRDTQAKKVSEVFGTIPELEVGKH